MYYHKDRKELLRHTLENMDMQILKNRDKSHYRSKWLRLYEAWQN